MWAKRALFAGALFVLVALAGCGCDNAGFEITKMQNRNAQDGRAMLADGLALARDGKYDQAYITLKRAQVLLEETDDISLQAQAKFWASYCREKLNDFAQARAGYMQVIERWPSTTSATQARLRLAGLDKAGATPAVAPAPAEPADARPTTQPQPKAIPGG